MDSRYSILVATFLHLVFEYNYLGLQVTFQEIELHYQGLSYYLFIANYHQKETTPARFYSVVVIFRAIADLVDHYISVVSY